MGTRGVVSWCVLGAALLGLAGCAGKQAPAAPNKVGAPPAVKPAAKPAPEPAVTSGLPELKPRRSRFGKLCQALERYDCEALCKQGAALSCTRLGYILMTGGAESPALVKPKFRPDLEGARQAWAKACKQGYQPACVELAALIERGVGGDRDGAAAARIRKEACEAGERYACAQRDEREPPTKVQGALACPNGTQPFRHVEELELAYVIREPAIFCGRLEGSQVQKDGPYLRFASLEDEAVHGVVVERGRYADDLKQGLWEQRDSLGHVLFRGSFQAGHEHGLVERFRPTDANYHEQAQYVNGKRHGKYSLESSEGSESGAYDAGEKHGIWTRVRTSVRSIKTETRYDHGRIVGDEVGYYEDGTVEHRVPHDGSGKFHGVAKYFREDGKLSHETQYSRGNKVRTKHFYPDGKLLRDTVYLPGGRAQVKLYYDTGQVQLEYTLDARGEYTERREYDRSGKLMQSDD
ncbi:MAG: hypothetical protein R3B07_28830 [Polyangiaceae bacterium]